MIQIIDEIRKPSFRNQLMSGLAQGSQVAATEIPRMLMGQQQGRQENEALKRFGTDITGIHDPKMRQLIVQNQLKGQGNKPDLSGAINALNTLESLVEKRGIGKGTRFSPFTGFGLGPESRRNRGEFESTQAAILPLFKSMFPRGMTEKEFKFIQEHYIPQAFDTEEKIRGKIKGLRQLVGGNDMSMDFIQQQQKSERPPLSSFGR